MNTDRIGTKIMDSDYSKLLTQLRGLSPRHFEQFIADVWQERQGWSTEVSPPGPDDGLDVMGQPPDGGPKTALQCKRKQEGDKVSSRRVQQYSALRNQWSDVEGVTIVTTSGFTKNAKELADRLDVKLINGRKLVQLIHRYDAENILEWYVQGQPEDRVKMSDDDLRFGDVKGSSDSGDAGADIPSGDDIINMLIQGIVIVVILYVFLSVVQIVFNIPVPFV